MGLVWDRLIVSLILMPFDPMGVIEVVSQTSFYLGTHKNDVSLRGQAFASDY